MASADVQGDATKPGSRKRPATQPQAWREPFELSFLYDEEGAYLPLERKRMHTFAPACAAFYAVPTPALVVDQQLKVVEVNESFLSRTGKSREHVLDNYLLSLMGNPTAIARGDMERLAARLELSLRSGER